MTAHDAASPLDAAPRAPEAPSTRARPKLALALGGALAATALFVAGYVTGQRALERRWSQPFVLLTQQEVLRLTTRGADPVPGARTQLLVPMPLARTRQSLEALTARDPVRVTVGSVGRGDRIELNLVLRNEGACTVTGVDGVAYGFDAFGAPSRLNAQGEHFVAVSAREQRVEPGGTMQLTQPLRHVDNASLAVAHIDHVTCADGTQWSRATP